MNPPATLLETMLQLALSAPDAPTQAAPVATRPGILQGCAQPQRNSQNH